MPNRNYKNGADFERKVCKMLEDAGSIAYRSAGSHGHADVIWFGLPQMVDHAFIDENQKVGERTNIYPSVALVQCKLNGAISKKEKEGLIEESEIVGAIPVLAYRKKNGRKYDVILENAETKERIEI